MLMTEDELRDANKSLPNFGLSVDGGDDDGIKMTTWGAFSGLRCVLSLDPVAALHLSRLLGHYVTLYCIRAEETAGRSHDEAPVDQPPSEIVSP